MVLSAVQTGKSLSHGKRYWMSNGSLTPVAVCAVFSIIVCAVNISAAMSSRRHAQTSWSPHQPQIPTTPMLRHDSSDATVMAYATGYGVTTYQRFVGSLRNSGFSGKIILVVSNTLEDGVEDYLVEKNVTFYPAKVVNCTHDMGKKAEGSRSHAREARTCFHPYPHLKARWGRFPILRDHLKACSECTGPVLVSDLRDTFFQRDPFGDGAREVSGLEVFEEFKDQKTDHWIVHFPVSKCKNISFVKPMLCSGTTIGTRESMLQYLTIMEEEMHAWMKNPNCCCNLQNGDDQSIHNYLFYTGKLPFAKAIPSRMGTVNTVGYQASKIYESHRQSLVNLRDDMNKSIAAAVPYYGSDGKYKWIGDHFGLTDKEGYLTQFDGSRSRVIHQYDRFGREGYDKWIQKRKGELWP